MQPFISAYHNASTDIIRLRLVMGKSQLESQSQSQMSTPQELNLQGKYQNSHNIIAKSQTFKDQISNQISNSNSNR